MIETYRCGCELVRGEPDISGRGPILDMQFCPLHWVRFDDGEWVRLDKPTRTEDQKAVQ